MNNLLQSSLILVSALTLAACGGGGSGGGGTPPVATSSVASIATSSTVTVSSSTAILSSLAVSSSSIQSRTSSTASSVTASRPAGEVTTTYTVTVNIPTSFAAQAADAGTSNLSASRFAVVQVDVTGTVLQRIPLYDGEVVLNGDGSWSIRFPGNPRVDYVIVADVVKPVDLSAGDSLRQADLVYAPVTQSNFDIDVGSTSAFSHFLDGLESGGSFADQNFDPTASANIDLVEAVVNGVQAIVVEQSLAGYTSVAAALAALQSQVSAVVTQEVINLKNPVAGSAVTLIRDEGGMFTYQSFNPGSLSDIYYDALVGMSNLASYRYNGSAFVLADSATPDQNLVLSEDGWVVPGNGTRVLAYNDDGSVTTELINGAGVKIELEAQQVFDLSGRNIREFLLVDVDTQDLAGIANSSAVFASGAKGYRIANRFMERLYVLEVDAATETDGVCVTDDRNDGMLASELGGNCNALGLWASGQQYEGPITDLNAILSPDVGPDSQGFKAITLLDSMVVQLVNDSAKTARFYIQAPAGPGSLTGQTILAGTGTWLQVNLPHLGVAEAAAFEVRMTSSVEDVNYLLPDVQYLVVKQAGYARFALGIDNSVSVETSFNGIANTGILDALSN